MNAFWIKQSDVFDKENMLNQSDFNTYIKENDEFTNLKQNLIDLKTIEHTFSLKNDEIYFHCF